MYRPRLAQALVLVAGIGLVASACTGDRDGPYTRWTNLDPAVEFEVRADWLQRQRGSPELDIQFIRNPGADFDRARGVQLLHISDPLCGIPCLSGPGYAARADDSTATVSGLSAVRQELEHAITEDGKDMARTEVWTLVASGTESLLLVGVRLIFGRFGHEKVKA
ncbi:MAG TPA: hypothetical protein QGF05_11750 [Dehalococcoidia bacterium]|nr:hypothetical protein [Dehalococcoidia bacterium]